MNASLCVLCLVAFAIVAVSVSGVLRLGLPWWDSYAAHLPPRHRVRLWLGLAALPAIVGVLAVIASFLPALGIGHDHCLAHGSHHPHLCPHHLARAPGIWLVSIAVLLGAQLLQAVAAFGRGAILSRHASVTLAQTTDSYACALVLPSDEPQAFVLGTLRPRIHVSRGLLALGRDVVEAVLAHECVHVRRRDLLWRALYPLLCMGHLPAVSAALRARLHATQELAADAEAAETLREGRLKIAEALIVLAKIQRAPAPGISITHGDLEARVRALLEAHDAFPTWRARVLLLSALVLPVALGASHDMIHHGLETLLGVLS